MHRKLLIFAIAMVLLGFFSLPIFVVAYASGGAILGAVVFLGIPALLQIPLYWMLYRSGVLPKVERDA